VASHGDQAAKEFLISPLQENPLNVDCVVALLYQMAVPTNIIPDGLCILVEGIQTAGILSLTAGVKLTGGEHTGRCSTDK